MIDNRNPNSCFIEFVPKSEGSYWNGEVELNIIASNESKLDDESKSSLIHLCQLVASTVALMEKDPTLVVRLEDFVYGDDEEAKSKAKSKVSTVIDGNVITLNFNSKK